MFGESDSESPRLSSPWEAFSASPSPCPGLASSLSSSVSSSDIEAELARRLQTEVPRLVPEVEEGNVEYKLKLSPSPERLTRLITQLKWRLLEGGGQALYEIGVGDGGQLIGLPRHEMEGSLDTLEKMAGELGATMMVLREIVVPQGVVASTGVDGVVDEGRGSQNAGHSPVASAGSALLKTPDLSRSTSATGSGSGSSDELETFPLELDGIDEQPAGPTSWSAQAQLPKSAHNANWPNKSHRRGTKHPQKAEHKKVRRVVKRSVNAAFTANTRTPLTSHLDHDPSGMSGTLDAPVVVASNTISSSMPPALGIPQVIISHASGMPLTDLDATNAITVPFESVPAGAPKSLPEDEVIIVEALVVRKLALEEAFLDFGGFSVLE